MGPGITMNSMSYIDRGNKSLAFFLANAGYDIWLVNWRGTRFSRGHVTLSPDNRKFWKIGFHDMAVHDLKTITNLVHAETGRKAIYIGFSMGSTVGFIYNIREQKSAEKTLKTIIHLAPIARFDHSTSLLKYLSPLWPLVRPLIMIIWNGEVFPYNKHSTFFCRPFPFQIKLCESFLKPFFGRNLQHTDPLTYPITNIQNRDSIATGTIDHYAQIIQSNRFAEYNYGVIENLKKYHQAKPPLYEFRELTLPQIMFVGEQDIMATIEDTRKIYDLIPKKSKCGYYTLKNFDHSDFVISKNAVEVYYHKLLSAIQDTDSGRCRNN
ncbi:hypothetical protein WA026_003822 [Henosepilachna vigintioctopunctata]|uniref:AB hydrolase-1 domain-containing protein n=1 Tax=Henosepilachna vigintioctopunctata TaxID=420089 RepID=A0AAW1U8Q8_9CUCU